MRRIERRERLRKLVVAIALAWAFGAPAIIAVLFQLNREWASVAMYAAIAPLVLAAACLGAVALVAPFIARTPAKRALTLAGIALAGVAFGWVLPTAAYALAALAFWAMTGSFTAHRQRSA